MSKELIDQILREIGLEKLGTEPENISCDARSESEIRK